MDVPVHVDVRVLHVDVRDLRVDVRVDVRPAVLQHGLVVERRCTRRRGGGWGVQPH